MQPGRRADSLSGCGLSERLRRGRASSRRRRRRALDQPAPPHAALVAAEAPISCARRPQRVRVVAAAVKRPRRLMRSPVRHALGASVTPV